MNKFETLAKDFHMEIIGYLILHSQPIIVVFLCQLQLSQTNIENEHLYILYVMHKKCETRIRQSHEGIALKLALTVIFTFIEDMRPFAILMISTRRP